MDQTDFVLYLDTDSNTGAYEGNVVFDTGACLETLNAIRAEGFTFGGVLTRQSVAGDVVPPGYDISIDGYLEAQKIQAPDNGCAFDCFGIERAELDFPRREPRHFGPKDGKFQIEGDFLACVTGGELDPRAVDVEVRIGDYTQVFPAGTLRRDRDGREIEWKFKNERGVETITSFEIEREHDGEWEFEIEGRGIPRATLLGDENLLVVELVIGDQTGEAQVTQIQKRHKLSYKNRHHDSCKQDDDDDDGDLQAQPEEGRVAALESGSDVLTASPNPFNATTTVSMRLASAGPVQLRIFDISGRLVQELYRGEMAAGEHRFHWDGHDLNGRSVASGVYIYRLDAPGTAASRKLVVAK